MQGAHSCPCAYWAKGFDKQFANVGMVSPFVSLGIGAHASHSFMTSCQPKGQRADNEPGTQV